MTRSLVEKVLWAKGATGLLHWRKKRVAPVQNRVQVVQKTLGRPVLPEFKYLLHPHLTTLRSFQVSGRCSRHSGSQPMAADLRRKLLFVDRFPHAYLCESIGPPKGSKRPLPGKLPPKSLKRGRYISWVPR